MKTFNVTLELSWEEVEAENAQEAAEICKEWICSDVQLFSVQEVGTKTTEEVEA